MSLDRTKRFERLLKTHQQLERLAQWRLAAATAERVESEKTRERAFSESLRIRAERELLLAAQCPPAFLHCTIAAEHLAENRVHEAEKRIADCLAHERKARESLVLAQRKTKQWEKLAGSAREADDAEEALAQQTQWDEHGLRQHGRNQDEFAPPEESDGVAAEMTL